MPENLITKIYRKAKEEGRLCSQCCWMISKENWKKGYRLCGSCWDANKGVNTPPKYRAYLDEPIDMTGEE
jgi:hypothetical protein